MATAIASATPCLDRYPVPQPGRTVVYMAEDAQPIVRQRLDALCGHRGLAIAALDLYAITADTVRLDLAEGQQRLEATIAHLRPRLLVLDPFVRLHRIDENRAGEVAALLGFLRRLQRRYHTAVLLVHHSRKNGSASQPGQALRGSSDIHAWGDSNLYLRRLRDRLVLTFEHRAAAAPEPVDLRLATGDTPHLTVLGEAIAAPTEQRLEPAVIEALREHAPLSSEALRRHVRVRGARLRQALASLSDVGRVIRGRRGWRLAADPDPSPP